MEYHPRQVDKGQAWVVLVADMLAGFLYSECYSTTGVFYVEYTQRYEVSKALAAWIAGLKMLTHLIGSMLFSIN